MRLPVKPAMTAQNCHPRLYNRHPRLDRGSHKTKRKVL